MGRGNVITTAASVRNKLVLAVAILATSVLGEATRVGALSGSPNKNGVALSASQLVQQADEVVLATKSVRIVGTVRQQVNLYSTDMQLFADGDSAGSIAVDGNRAQLLLIGSQFYLKGTTSFWSQTFGQSAANAAHLAQEWLVVPRSSITGLGANLNMAHIESLFELAAHSAMTKIAPAQVDGHLAIGVRIAGLGTLWIDQTGLRPVEFDGTVAGNVLAIRFGGWGAGSLPTAPSGAVFSETVPT